MNIFLKILILLVVFAAVGLAAYFLVGWWNDRPKTLNNEAIYSNQGTNEPEKPVELADVVIPWDSSGSATSVINYLKNKPEYVGALDKLLVSTGQTDSCAVTVPEGNLALVNWFGSFNWPEGTGQGLILSVKEKDNNGWCGGINGYRSVVYILQKNQSGQYLINYVQDAGMSSMEKFFFVKDINADRLVELAFANGSCGAHTCSMAVYVLKYEQGIWEKILDAEMPTAEVTLKDVSGTAQEEFILKGGTVSSVGAGAQRQRVEVYGFDAAQGQYALWSKDYEQQDDIYFLVMDSYYALSKKDYSTALSLAQKALDHPDWDNFMEGYYDDTSSYTVSEQKQIKDHILGYAALEVMMAHLALPDHDQKKAAQALSLIKTNYSTKDKYYYEAGSKLLQEYSASSDLHKACAAMEKQALSYGSEANLLPWVGYNQENIELKGFCPMEY